MNHQDYFQRLKAIGVRTDRRIEVMYCDLFRITENSFLKECHATEAFELYDFVKEEEKFRELHELRRHMENLLHWMYPDGLPSWPTATNRRFKELTNPYLGAGYEPISSKNFSMSDQCISAAFNLRSGLPGEQFSRDREILLQKLKDRHYSAAAIEHYISEGKENIHIPKIGLDLMKQEIDILKQEESFLPEMPQIITFSTTWFQKYMNIFDKFSNTGLAIYHNQRVDLEHKGAAWKAILNALRDQFLQRNLDISSVEKNNELEMKHCAILVNKKLQGIKELPLKTAEALTMMHYKDRKLNFRRIHVTDIDEENIYFENNGSPGYLQANTAIKNLDKHLLNRKA